MLEESAFYGILTNDLKARVNRDDDFTTAVLSQLPSPIAQSVACRT